MTTATPQVQVPVRVERTRFVAAELQIDATLVETQVLARCDRGGELQNWGGGSGGDGGRCGSGRRAGRRRRARRRRARGRRERRWSCGRRSRVRGGRSCFCGGRSCSWGGRSCSWSGRGRSGGGVCGQQQRWTRRLTEVEVAGEIAETRCFFTHARTGIGTPVGLCIQTLPPMKSSSMNFKYASWLSC